MKESDRKVVIVLAASSEDVRQLTPMKAMLHAELARTRLNYRASLAFLSTQLLVTLVTLVLGYSARVTIVAMLLCAFAIVVGRAVNAWTTKMAVNDASTK